MVSDPPPPADFADDCPNVAQAFDAFASTVWRVLRRFGVHDHALEDATHDVFVVAHRRWDTFEGRSTRKTWLVGIAARVAKTHRTKQRRPAGLAALTRTGTMPDPPAQTASPFESTDRKQREQLLHALLSTLPPLQESLIVLTVLDDQTVTEAAIALGVDRRRAYYERTRGLATLEKLLSSRMNAAERVGETP